MSYLMNILENTHGVNREVAKLISFLEFYLRNIRIYTHSLWNEIKSINTTDKSPGFLHVFFLFISERFDNLCYKKDIFLITW